MRKIGFFVLIFLLSSLFTPFTADTTTALAAAHSPIQSDLLTLMAGQTSGQQISIILYLGDQEDVNKISGRDNTEKQKNIIEALRRKADTTQIRLRQLLQLLKNQGLIQSYTPLWIRNALAITASTTAINNLAQLPEVGSIVPDSSFQAPANPAPQASIPGVENNLTLINAPALWSLGFKGQGLVIASMDSGVDNSHPDISAQWRGGTNSWYDPYNQHATPTDLSGHGTWTTGIMVGGNASGSAIGVAPQAKWIGVKIFNDNNVATASAIHLGFQWLLDPDGNAATADGPQIVNNSWSYGNPGCNLDFEPDLQTLVAAGITPVFAAGNYGPTDSSSISPANNPSAFAVGSINNNSVIASDSSRGPTSCGSTSRTFPDVVAPGVNINTTDIYGFYYTATGTSFAAPHVSGGIALLKQAFPNLTVAQIKNVLSSTAVDLGTAGVDNAYGHGRIDLLAAYNSLNGVVVTPTPTATATPTNTPVPPTATPTNTPVPPTATATNTPVPPTATPTNTPVPPTATANNTPIPPTATATNTPVPPTATATNTPVPPTATATNTPIPPTATATNTPLPPTATATNTPMPPTNTPTKTPVSPTATATNTPVPPTATATNTPLPPTATATKTPVPPTATVTPTNTPVIPTATNTPIPPTATNTPTAIATPTNTPISGGGCNPFIITKAVDDGAGSCGSLSYALAQATTATKPLVITFDNAITTVSLTGGAFNMPSGGVTLDGGCNTVSGRGVPKVRIMSSTGAQANGLLLSSNVTINGLAITGFSGFGVVINGNNNVIKCSWLGTADGVIAAPNGGGILIKSGASNNTLGQANLPASGNLLSGNIDAGIETYNGANNQLYYNWIGLQKDGVSSLKNGNTTVRTLQGAKLIYKTGNRLRN